MIGFPSWVAFSVIRFPFFSCVTTRHADIGPGGQALPADAAPERIVFVAILATFALAHGVAFALAGPVFVFHSILLSGTAPQVR